MDEAAESAIVKAEAGGAVETEEAGSAESADAVGIQREIVLERRVAGGAEVVGFERRGSVQAVIADRNAGKFIERGVADPAVGRKNKRKNSVGDRPEGGSGRSRQQTTREGAPPCGQGQYSALLNTFTSPGMQARMSNLSAMVDNALKILPCN